MVALIRNMMEADFNQSKNQIGSLMRNETLSVRTMRLYAKQISFTYLQKTLSDYVSAIAGDETLNFELDSLRVDKGQIPRNMAHLKDHVIQLMQLLMSEQTLALLPREIRGICYSIQTLCEKYFGDKENLSDIVRQSISGFFILRFIGPAVTMPKDYGLLGLGLDLTNTQQRNLILVQKVLQQICIGTPFGSKEKYLIPLNDFVEQFQGDMDAFINSLTEDPEQNLRPFPEYDTYTIDSFAEREMELQDKMRDLRMESAKVVVDFFAANRTEIITFIRENAEEVTGKTTEAPVMLQELQYVFGQIGMPADNMILDEVQSLRDLLKDERNQRQSLQEQLNDLQAEFNAQTQNLKELTDFKNDHALYLRQLQMELDETTRDLDTIRTDMEKSLVTEAESILFKCRNFFSANANMMRNQLKNVQDSLHADNDRRARILELLNQDLGLNSSSSTFQPVLDALQNQNEINVADSVPLSAQETLLMAKKRQAKASKAPTSKIPSKKGLVLFVEGLKSTRDSETVTAMRTSMFSQAEEKKSLNIVNTNTSASSSSDESDESQESQQQKDIGLQLQEIKQSMTAPRVKAKKTGTSFNINDILTEAAGEFRRNYGALKSLVEHLVATCQVLLNENEEIRTKFHHEWLAQQQQIKQLNEELKSVMTEQENQSKHEADAIRQKRQLSDSMLEENRMVRSRIGVVLNTIDAGMAVNTEMFKVPLEDGNPVDNGLSEENLQLRKTKTSLQQQNADMQSKIQSLNAKIKELEKKLATLTKKSNEEIEQLNRINNRLRDEFDHVKETGSSLSSTLRDNLDSQGEYIATLEKQLSEAQKEKDDSKLQLQEIKKELIEKKTYGNEDLGEEITRMQSQLKLQERQMKRLEQENQELKAAK
eukprot:TRINITY_DN369_c0_g2_i4.p1 TRINITY_DN369_c0_g2~~TRINITY_DN369_c0_g2_i4.p1  ORF type:complete len:938 (-),score=336.46 TRINITY_DN369_c0_g2_i4:9-2654(-)